MTTSMHGFHHLSLRVTEIARSRAFYVDSLQFPVQSEGPGRLIINVYGTMVVLIGDDPHTVKDDRFNPYRVGLDHLGLNVPDVQLLDGLLEKLKQANVPNNGIQYDERSRSTHISFYDPDGIAWEFYFAPTRQE